MVEQCKWCHDYVHRVDGVWVRVSDGAALCETVTGYRGQHDPAGDVLYH